VVAVFPLALSNSVDATPATSAVKLVKAI